MTKPTTAKAGALLILVGDGESPQVFAAPCGLTTKGINFAAETSDTTVPDCDDPDAPAWTERAVRTLSAGVTGSGVLAAEAVDTWWDWFESAEPRDVRVKINSAAFAHLYFAGRMLLTEFEVNGEQGGKVETSITLASDGEFVKVTET